MSTGARSSGTEASVRPPTHSERYCRRSELRGLSRMAAMLTALALPLPADSASPADTTSPLVASATSCDVARAPDGLCIAIGVRVPVRDAGGRYRPGAVRAIFQAPQLDGDGDVPVVSEGEFLEVCLRSRDSGWITLWDYDAEGGVVAQLPNRWSPPTEPDGIGVRVQAGQVLCVGGARDRYKIRLFPPFGPSRLHLHWTADDADQLRPEMLGASRSARQIVAEPLGDGGDAPATDPPFRSLDWIYEVQPNATRP